MARAWIPLAATEPGALPLVCARTGQPADRFLSLPARARAGWTWWLLPLGVLPFLVARHFAPEVTVLVPISPGTGRLLERLRLLHLLALVEAALLVGVGLVSERRGVLLAGATSLVAVALIRALETTFSVRAKLDPSARGMLLTGVHPAFRDAVDGIQQAGWKLVTGLAEAPNPSRQGETCRSRGQHRRGPMA